MLKSNSKSLGNDVVSPEITSQSKMTIIIITILIKAHQHKATGRKTRLDMQNYGCNGNLLCYHGVVERNRISSLQSHGKALEKNVVSRVSSLIVVIRLPISCVSSMAISCHVPAVSIITIMQRLTASLPKYLPKQILYTILAKKNNLNKLELEHS